MGCTERDQPERYRAYGDAERLGDSGRTVVAWLLICTSV